MATRKRTTAGGPPEPSADPAILNSETPIAGDIKPLTDQQRAWRNLRKQAKFIVLGALGTWYFEVPAHTLDVLEAGGWPGRLAILALILLTATVALFGHLITLPYRGVHPNYARWNSDPLLRQLIPAVTICIVSGFLSLLLTLSPLCAPPPPTPLTLAQILADAARAAGGSVQSAAYGAQEAIAATVAGEQLHGSSISSSMSKAGWLGKQASSGVATGWSKVALDTAAIARGLKQAQGGVDALATKLGVHGHAAELQRALDATQARARAWAEGNVHAMGWTGAVVGSIAAYLLVFGVLGCLSLFTNSTRSS